MGIYLENREGAWFLTGTVSRPEDAHLARDMVLLRDDVGQIEDEIKVAGESSEPPKELEISISDSAKNLALNLNILLSTEISGVSIHAKVENGRVVLDGIVETEAEKLLVEEKVKLTTGAEVINRLEVGTGKNLNDKSEEVLSFISTIGIIVFLLVPCLLIFLYYKNYKTSLPSKNE